MFARVQQFQQPAAKLDELIEVAREQLPAAKHLAGFSGFYYLVDRDNGRALVISLWETEEDLRQVEPGGGASIRDQVEAQVGAAPPPAEVFQVCLSAS